MALFQVMRKILIGFLGIREAWQPFLGIAKRKLIQDLQN